MNVAERPRLYQFVMLVLCLYALLALAFHSLFKLDDASRRILDGADLVVCVFFFLDFVISLVKAPDRWRYFYTWGWIDLLSSLPMIDALRWGRAARVVRILRVLRGVRAAKILASFILERRAESTFLAAALVSVILVVISSVSILHFEKEEGGNIKTAEDAIWWSMVTITTVGYGDKVPVTPEGRIVATLLMVAGVGLFGTFSGFVAAWFLAPKNQNRQNELELIRTELADIKKILQTHYQNSESGQSNTRPPQLG